MNILLLGPPGAGKGTQGERLAERLGLRKIATGDVLRAAVKDGTARGREAKGYMDRGELVPDEVILGIMKEALAEPSSERGVILDGVVRTVPQAEGLERVLGELGRHLDVVLLFDVDEDELVSRLSSRTICEGCQTPYSGRPPGDTCEKCGGRLVRRKDDEPQAVRTRMRAYREQTAPVIEWYRNHAEGKVKKAAPVRIVTVNAAGPVDEITERVMRDLTPAGA
ncbi:MAG TPA: adenylate kinase [Gemmatimonadaceae bacterium]|nr:adenylate kinase [Gemmatimonadaceae bacterium]